MPYSLGVDLGTTFSAAAVLVDGHAEIAPIGRRGPAIPSVLFQRDDGTLLVGEAAERRSASEPARATRGFKRRFGDPAPILLGQTPHTADSLMARLSRFVVETVAEQRGGRPDQVVITHPANYGPYKLDLLRQVAQAADIDDVSFISEPEAAAVHYAERQRISSGELVAVYDLGGGTFDAAVLRKTADGFELLGTPEGLAHLGGMDFDEAVLGHVRAAVGGRLQRLDPTEPGVLSSAMRLRAECTAAKEALSFDSEATIPVLFPSFQSEVTITRDEFEAMIAPRIGETVAALNRAVAAAGITMDDLARVLLVGGSSRIPVIRRTVAAATGRPVAVDSHPKFAVAIGAVLASAAATAQPVAVAASAGTVPPAAPADGAPPGSAVAVAGGPVLVADGSGAGPPLERRRRLHQTPWFRLTAAAVAAGLLAGGLWLRHAGRDGASTAAGRRPVALVTAPSSPATEAPPVPAPPPAVEAGPWRVVRDLPTARQQVAGAVTDGTLWVIGGLVGDSASAKVEGYDPAIDTWKSAPDLPLPLHHAMAVTYRGELVVLGGWTPQGANLSGTASNRVFALRGGTWSELPPLTRPRAAGAAAVVDDRIVVVGGQANGALVAPSEVFDGTRWADAPPLPTPRDHLAAVSDGSFVYAVGGRFLSADANVATVERYDPVARRWSRLPDMPTARGGLGADLVGRRIVAVGGERPTGVFDTVEALDLDSRAWTALPAMRTPRHGMAVLAAGSSIYALGGSLQPTHAHAATTAEVLDLRP